MLRKTQRVLMLKYIPLSLNFQLMQKMNSFVINWEIYARYKAEDQF